MKNLVGPLLLLAAAAPCLAQDAGGRPSFALDLDPRFGRGGAVRSLRAGRLKLESVRAARFDAEGRIVVAGRRLVRVRRESVYVPLVARLLPDGRLDATFGDRGIAALPVSGSPTGLDVDSQGRIVVCGLFAGQGRTYLAARLESDGALDESFSTDGLVEGSSVSDRRVNGVRASPVDDSLLVLVEDVRAGQGVVRIASDGSRDLAYGGGGFAGLPAGPYDLAVDSQGRAVVAENSPVGLLRLAADGSRDAFDVGARIANAHGDPVTITSVSIDDEDRVAVYAAEIGTGVGLLRFLPDGAPDPTFGEAGVLATPPGVPGDARGGVEVRLGAAAKAGRFAVAASLFYLTPDFRHVVGGGLYVQLLDRATPDRVATYVTRDKTSRRTRATTNPVAVLVTDDGRAAYVVGHVDTPVRGAEHQRETPFVLRLDLAGATRRPAPSLVVEWTGTPSIVPGMGARFDASFRVTNRGRAASPSVRAAVFFSSDDVLDAFDVEILDQVVPSLGRGASRTIPLLDAPSATAPPPGTRLIVALQTETADPRRRVAVSLPIE